MTVQLDTKRMRACSALLPAPGDSVVVECLDEIEQLRAALSSSRAECERLRADAERYRWLRSQDTGLHELDRALFETISDDCHPPYRSMKHGADLDAAIDAVITKTKGDSHG